MDTRSGYRFRVRRSVWDHRSDGPAAAVGITVAARRDGRAPPFRGTGPAVPVPSFFRVLPEGPNYVTPSIYVAHCQAPIPADDGITDRFGRTEGTDGASWSGGRFPATDRAWPTTLHPGQVEVGEGPVRTPDFRDLRHPGVLEAENAVYDG